VAALARDAFAAVHKSEARMRIGAELLGKICMARFTRFGSDVIRRIVKCRMLLLTGWLWSGSRGLQGGA
jgi:hypothetical protein